MLVASGLYAFGGESVIFQNGKSKPSFADEALRAVYQLAILCAQLDLFGANYISA